VQSCLRQDLRENHGPFRVVIHGRLTRGGEIERPKITADRLQLESCLQDKLKEIRLGRGQSGAFELKIEKTADGAPGAAPGKTLLLNLEEAKKLE
jgi:hypothetical protein